MTGIEDGLYNPELVAIMLAAFAKIGITRRGVESISQCDIDNLSDSDWTTLRRIYKEAFKEWIALKP